MQKVLVWLATISFLVACGQDTSTTKNVLGVITLNIDPVSSGASPQIVLADSSASFGQLGLTDILETTSNTRYISAKFSVKNQTQTAFQNLTLYAVNQSSGVAGTPFKEMVNFGDSSTTAANAKALKPTHAMTLNASSQAVVNNSAADFQAFRPTEASTVQSQARQQGILTNNDTVLEYGFVARGSTGRGIAVGQTGSLTLAYKFPNSGSPSENTYRFKATFVLVNEAQTRVTRSPEEDTSNAVARATPLQASEVALLGSDSATSSVGSTVRLNNPKIGTAPTYLLPETNPPVATSDIEVFLGESSTWANAKTTYGAKGDGVSDDSVALQNALNDLGATGKKTVLYLPSGTYKISKTLVLEKKVNVAILGQDPSTTKLIWAGGRNSGPNFDGNTGVMFLGQNSAYVRLGRLTFDGKSQANWAVRLRWGSYASGDYFPTGWQFHDLVFQDADVGIGAGYIGNNTPQDTAEYSQVYRSKFIRCSYGGINTQDYNSLLWGVRDSYFEANGVGVRVDLGNVNIYDSVFKNSSESDILAATVSFISARGNYSSNSRKFFVSDGNTGVVNLQNNTILDALEPPIHPVNTEEMVLMGNTIRSSGIAVNFAGYGGLFSVGNRFSANTWLTRNTSQSFVRSLDDLAGSSLVASEPVLPPTPALFSGQRITVSGLTGAAIQSAIDQAAAFAGQHPVVYIPAGSYAVSQSLVVPANLDVQLVGDGAASSLVATSANTVLKLLGPSRARVQDISLSGGYNGPANGIEISNADQNNGAVILNSVSIVGANTEGIGVDVVGIDQTHVELIMPHYIGGKGGSVRVSGGSNASTNLEQPANVRVVDGFSGVGGDANSYTYQVRSGGRLLLLDQWAEVNAKRFLEITTLGHATLSGGNFGFGTRPPDSDPVIGASGISGRLSVIGVLFGNAVLSATGNNPNQNFLLASSRLDGWRQGASAESRFVNTATAGTNKSLMNVGHNIWFDTAPNNTDVTDAWLRTMTKQLREDLSKRLSNPPNGATAVELTRVSVGIANQGIVISK